MVQVVPRWIKLVLALFTDYVNDSWTLFHYIVCCRLGGAHPLAEAHP